jgi:hypothetical protein
VIGLDNAAQAVGKAVAGKAVRAWLAHRASTKDRSRELSELITATFPDRIHRRRIGRQIEDIADGVQQRLQPLCAVEFDSLTDNEKTAAMLAVAGTIIAADLSDDALFAADANATALVRDIRRQFPDPACSAGLGDVATQFHDLLLAECINDYVHLVLGLNEFVPRASQAMLSRLSDLGSEMCRMLDRLPVRTMNAPSGDHFDDEFRREYLGVISKTLDELRFFGVGLENRAPRTTLSVAYISLNVGKVQPASVLIGELRPVSAPASQRFLPLAEWHESVRDVHPATLQVEAALAKNHRMLIRGEAGSGKTTLLSWLAVTASRGRFTGPLAQLNGHVPFLVKLRSYAGQKLPRPEQFMDNLASSIAGRMPQAWVDRQLLSGRVILLVDGVDELADGQRRHVRTWLRELIAAYPAARMVITSRPAAAAVDWLDGLEVGSATLSRMSPADIRLFIRQWHEAARDADSLPAHVRSVSEYEYSLVARLRTNQHLQSLAETPLLCAMLCALNIDQQKHLPRNRMELYAAALGMLLRRRDESREIPSYQTVSIDDESKLALLRDLAWRLTLYNRSETSKDDAVRWVQNRLDTMPHVTESGSIVFDHLLHRGGVLREPREGQIDFIHRSFQEYLAAAEAAKQDHLDLLVNRAHLKLWRGIVVMAAGHTIEPLRRKLVNGILGRAEREPHHRTRLRLLAVACIETMSTVPTDTLQALEDCFQNLIPPSGYAEARSLASAGDHVLRRLPRNLRQLPAASAVATVATVVEINGPDALCLLQHYGTDSRLEVVRELISAWRYFDPEQYAIKVLADSSLSGGYVELPKGVPLKNVRHLRRLSHLSARLALGDIESAVLADLTGMKSFFLTGCIGLMSLTPLGCHPDMDFLKLADAPLAEGISALGNQFPKLVELHLTNSAQLRDLSPVTSVPTLEGLRLGCCPQIDDLSPLAQLPHLFSLDLSECTGITGLTALANCRNLEVVNLNGIPTVLDIAPLASHKKLIITIDSDQRFVNRETLGPGVKILVS